MLVVLTQIFTKSGTDFHIIVLIRAMFVLSVFFIQRNVVAELQNHFIVFAWGEVFAYQWGEWRWHGAGFLRAAFHAGAAFDAAVGIGVALVAALDGLIGAQ